MILPTKHLPPERALLSVGARLLESLHGPTTVSGLWEAVRGASSERGEFAPITYDWFVLALDLLYALGAIDLERGLVQRSSR